ncbi:GL11218 [Drosophila persimilis]|uniref:GL11218 n=1 Tax=Drosophila persimilis TaxID=7234 RepID=B4GDD8_DROPE|nr:GL11218 [Drosophila persimilis]
MEITDVHGLLSPPPHSRSHSHSHSHSPYDTKDHVKELEFYKNLAAKAASLANQQPASPLAMPLPMPMPMQIDADADADADEDEADGDDAAEALRLRQEEQAQAKAFAAHLNGTMQDMINLQKLQNLATLQQQQQQQQQHPHPHPHPHPHTHPHHGHHHHHPATAAALASLQGLAASVFNSPLNLSVGAEPAAAVGAASTSAARVSPPHSSCHTGSKNKTSKANGGGNTNAHNSSNSGCGSVSGSGSGSGGGNASSSQHPDNPSSSSSPHALNATSLANVLAAATASPPPALQAPPASAQMPQLILASGQLVQGVQGAQLLIPTAQGIAVQTILTIPVSPQIPTTEQFLPNAFGAYATYQQQQQQQLNASNGELTITKSLGPPTATATRASSASPREDSPGPGPSTSSASLMQPLKLSPSSRSEPPQLSPNGNDNDNDLLMDSPMHSLRRCTPPNYRRSNRTFTGTATSPARTTSQTTSAWSRRRSVRGAPPSRPRPWSCSMRTLSATRIHRLKDGPDAKYYNTLNLFAYGTYKEYRANPGDYIELNPAMQKKLQHLTIVSLAIKTKSIPYALLQSELEIDNVRHLEDIIIEAIYADIIHGKLFQNTRILEVEYAQGRDIPPGNTGKIVETLQAWVNSCDGVSSCIENQIKYANSEKSKRLFNKDRVEQDLINLKKMLKSQASDSDENMQIDTHGPSGSGGLSLADLRKKPSKMKAQRNAVVGLKFSK